MSSCMPALTPTDIMVWARTLAVMLGPAKKYKILLSGLIPMPERQVTVAPFRLAPQYSAESIFTSGLILPFWIIKLQFCRHATIWSDSVRSFPHSPILIAPFLYMATVARPLRGGMATIPFDIAP